MNYRNLLLAASLAITAPNHVPASEDQPPPTPELLIDERLDRFGLFTGCRPISVVVESLGKDAKDIGLDQDTLILAVESRLRSARIYAADSRFSLYLRVSVVGSAFSHQLVFSKPMFDMASGEPGVAKTWMNSGTGTHGRDSTYIVGRVREQMDQFLVDYLRVNEPDCG